MPKVTAVTLLKAAPGAEDKVRAHALSLVEPSRAEPGNISYTAYRHPEEPDSWLVFEEWTDRAAFDAHLASPHLAVALAAGPELLTAPPLEHVFEAQD